MKKGMRIFTLLLTLAIVDINMTACDTNDISRPDDDNLMGDEHPSDGTISNPDESINPTIGDKAPMSGMVNLWYKNHALLRQRMSTIQMVHTSSRILKCSPRHRTLA